MEKRSIYVRDFIKENPNTILLDAGDFVTMSQHTLKDSLISEAYGLLPYDAILYGDQELVLDARTLNRMRGQLGTTLVGTNIDRSDFFTSKVIRRKGLRVAVMGIMDPYAIKFYPEEVKNRIRLSDPIKSVKKEMKKLSNKADIFILLTHQGFDLDQELAKKIDGLDLIIGSHSQTKIESPKEVNDALIVQAGKSGYYVGVVEIKTKKGKVVEKSGKIDTMKFDMPDDPRIIKMIEEYESKTGRMNMRKKKLKEKTNG
jgi:5'-nucleotidase